MKTIQELIAKLESLTYTGVSIDNRGALLTEEGFDITYSVNFLGDPPHRSDYPVQIVIQIRKGDKYVFSWGCEDNESNRLFVNFYLKAKSFAYGEEMKIQDKFQEDAKKEFFNL